MRNGAAVSAWVKPVKLKPLAKKHVRFYACSDNSAHILSGCGLEDWDSIPDRGIFSSPSMLRTALGSETWR
jgi:hypothetical protein